MSGKPGIYWVRNDLRLDDNDPLLTALAEHERVVVFYYFDLRHFRVLPDPGFRKTGPHRLAFQLAAVADLRQRLRARGGELVVRWGNSPATALAELADRTAATAVYAQREIMSEETDDERRVAAALPGDCTLHLIRGKTLYHPDDLPFDAAAVPEPFREFRRPVERESAVRAPREAPTRVPTVEDVEAGPLPTPEQFGFSAEEVGQPALPGGETAALARLAYYLDETGLVERYRRTRNLSLGPDYSSKFSAYLAYGCLSPRRVYAEVRRYGEATGKHSGGNSLLFELRWRDYFLFLGRKYGNRIFRPGGLREKETDWRQDRELFESWRLGRTGIPFVDAHMRELLLTGFMSNRGRVNCASFLSRDYRIDWRWGAAWFENRLIDYEVCANWFNWHTQALEIYYTSPPWQGLKYDADGSYVKTWLPELAALPAPLLHAPWKMAEEGLLESTDFDLERDYYRPRVENSKWDWAWGRIKTGDASSPRRRKKPRSK